MLDIIASIYDGEDDDKFRIRITSDKTNNDIFKLSDIAELTNDTNRNLMNNVYIDMFELDSDGNEIAKAFESELMLFYDIYDVKTILDIADANCADALEYIEKLLESDEYNRDLSDYDYDEILMTWGKNIVSGALHRFYVYPEYRKLGIGKTMINSLDKLLEMALNLKLRCLVTYPKPDDGQSDNMLEIMIKNIVNNGFRPLFESDSHYIRDYIDEYFDYMEN